jgi:hypothetical protein
VKLSDEEVAAAVVVAHLLQPTVVAADEPGSAHPPAWRFSGRWWARPVAARRDRPFY